MSQQSCYKVLNTIFSQVLDWLTLSSSQKNFAFRIFFSQFLHPLAIQFFNSLTTFNFFWKLDLILNLNKLCLHYKNFLSLKNLNIVIPVHINPLSSCQASKHWLFRTHLKLHVLIYIRFCWSLKLYSANNLDLEIVIQQIMRRLTYLIH